MKQPKIRPRGNGYVPSPLEVKTARGTMTQTEASLLVYTTQERWSNWERGINRMHPAQWELFNIKTGKSQETANDVFRGTNGSH